MISAKLKTEEDIVKAIKFLGEHKQAIPYLNTAGTNLEDLDEYQSYMGLDPRIPPKKTLFFTIMRFIITTFNL